MANTLSVGSKCALLLPKKFINPQKTPAKGLVINKMFDSRFLVLIEEVWQFKGFPRNDITGKLVLSNKIKTVIWGWQEVPGIVEDYLIVPARQENLREIRHEVIDSMIKESINDFNIINNYI